MRNQPRVVGFPGNAGTTSPGQEEVPWPRLGDPGTLGLEVHRVSDIGASRMTTRLTPRSPRMSDPGPRRRAGQDGAAEGSGQG